MSIKDKYVDVRYHMNTGEAKYIVQNAYCKDHPKRISFTKKDIIRKMHRSHYLFHFDVHDIMYKAKYNMEC